MKILAINCNPDLKYFSQRGMVFDVDYKSISRLTFPLVYLSKVKDSDGTMVDMYTPDVKSYLENQDTSKYGIVLVGWNPNDYSNALKHTGGYTYPIPLKSGAYVCTIRQDAIPNNIYPIHEMHHALCAIINNQLGDHVPKDFMDITPVNGQWLPYYKNDYRDTDPLSNFNQTWNNIKPFLSKLITYAPNPTYKYFKANEIVGLKTELVQKLDKMREECGFPFVITSGYRTQAQNDMLKDSVSDSAHVSGLAVDLAIKDSATRFKLITVALQNGITRIGIGKDFVHLDIDESKPQNCIWTYY